MRKTELVKRVSEATGLKYDDALKAVEVFFDSIQDALLKREDVRIVNFGKFYVKKTNARRGRNPKANQEIKLKPRYLARFRPSRKLKLSLASINPELESESDIIPDNKE